MTRQEKKFKKLARKKVALVARITTLERFLHGSRETSSYYVDRMLDLRAELAEIEFDIGCLEKGVK